MLHAVHQAVDCMASMGVTVSVGFMGSWGPWFAATELRPVAERRCFAASIQIFLNVSLISNDHPKEDFNPPATMQRGKHGSGGVIPGYPMGSGREH